MKSLIFTFLLGVGAIHGFAEEGKQSDTNSQRHKISTAALKSIPIQEGGRVNPFDSFARETMMLVYGKGTYNKRPAHEVVMTWFLLPEAWMEKPIVQIKFKQLKETLKLADGESYFKPSELLSNDRCKLAFLELAGKQQEREKLDPYYQAVSRLQNQLGLFSSVTSGEVFRLLPVSEQDSWASVGEPIFLNTVGAQFQDMAKAFINAISAGIAEDVSAEKVREIEAQLESAVGSFTKAAQSNASTKYPLEKEISLEVHYNSLDPFKWSWIFYLLGVMVLGAASFTANKKVYQVAWLVTIAGFLLHTYGFGLRVYIAGRPPVTNMYETVVWVSWGGILFGMIIEAIYKQRFILMCGGIGAVFCLILTSLAPSILDPSISPLQPVLVSNFWLLIHVLTITISYAAFLLAFVLGDIGLFYAIRDELKYKEKLKNIANAIYRAEQIGVVLIAAGIILGGIWADYSWGRFWGWDPKETWALIALLGYLALLHGRMAGWLGNWGMIAGAIAAFSLVIMAWYGVNFVLGAGLHSYGFGGGGLQYVASFVVAHFIYIIYALIVRNRSSRKLGSI